MSGSDWQVASRDEAGVFSRRNGSGFQLVGGNNSDGYLALRPGSALSNSSNGSLTLRNKAPRIQFEVSTAKAKFRFKGPDGSATTDRALDIAERMAT